jgi:hypothetical protein
LICPFRRGVEERTDQWLADALANISSSDEEHRHHTLVVVTSDHGMTDTGSHGGTSHHEIDTTLMFVQAKDGTQWPDRVASCRTGAVRPVLQISLAPTLALIFGVPVPMNNVASLIPDVFVHADAGEFALAACMVAKQISTVVEANGGLPCNLDQCRFLTPAKVASFEKSCHVRDIVAQPWYADAMGHVSHEVYAAAEMLCGESGIAFIDAVRVSSECSSTALNLHSSHSMLPLFASVSVAVIALLVAAATLLIPRRECFGTFTAAVTAHCVCMFTTTFMEEEHMIVYFLVSFLHSQALRSLVLNPSYSRRCGLESCLFSWVGCLLLRSFCSGGAKWAHLFDIRSVVLSSMLLRRGLSVVSAAIFCFTASSLRHPRTVSVIFNVAIIMSAAASVDGFDQSLGRQIRCFAFFAFILASLTGVFIFSECRIQSAAFFFGGIAFLLMNPSLHAPACLVFCIIPFFASKFLSSLSTTVQGLFVHYVALHAFFSVGMSNALSSVDVLAPFRLVENYNRWMALIVTFLCAYGLSIGVGLRLVSCCSIASVDAKSSTLSLHRIVSSFITARIAVSACLCVATVILQQHLFVWTVLAPRLLFEMANCCAALLFSLFVACWGASPSQPNSK